MGWSQSEMAHHLGVPATDVQAWETGAQAPTFQQAELIESLFRRSEASILEIQEAPRAENLLDQGRLGSVSLRDLVRDGADKGSKV